MDGHVKVDGHITAAALQKLAVFRMIHANFSKLIGKGPIAFEFQGRPLSWIIQLTSVSPSTLDLT